MRRASTWILLALGLCDLSVSRRSRFYGRPTPQVTAFKTIDRAVRELLAVVLEADAHREPEASAESAAIP